jgi:hypothetical protein
LVFLQLDVETVKETANYLYGIGTEKAQELGQTLSQLELTWQLVVRCSTDLVLSFCVY